MKKARDSGRGRGPPRDDVAHNTAHGDTSVGGIDVHTWVGGQGHSLRVLHGVRLSLAPLRPESVKFGVEGRAPDRDRLWVEELIPNRAVRLTSPTDPCASREDRCSGNIHHSDHGCQYTSIAFGLRCREAGVQPSLGSVGDAYDNALCESFFATLECELLDRRRFVTPAEARLAVFDYIEGWYNPRRRHSALDYLSPTAYEQRELVQA
jgi:transposase InsO family protein